jgi:aromatic-L-amino-acid decarboxylase
VVCFRYKGTDEENQDILDAVNASGKVFLSHTVLNGQFVIRLAIGNLGTGRDDVGQAWELLRNAVPA